MNKILVVEDDRKTANLIRLYLQQSGYTVDVAADGNTALDIAHNWQPDLILLDLMLPEIDGLEVCRMLRMTGSVPIIILTAKSTEDDVLRGLDLGADDYITKPFSPREVVARVRTVLRRSSKESQPTRKELKFGDLLVNLTRHEVRIKDDIIHLTPKEFKLLETMAKEPGRAFTRLELVERAFGYDYEGLERTVDAHVMNLRKKIERNPSHHNYVETVYGIGYRFAEPTGHAV
ncbi:response regulator transcription factor [Phototrophicus methaneseepsis]|uniref:Response regulator transcription factor n=1 Tax=Phototrophicus methaneseepsis TaxID=2710758 RepID=A0A7S8E8A7_9CHLR|nr:response regulator transcription factor [Phototrophicus methaneseepsis]QPC82190.1 response regulator transcription factor [Phototrophicus methaneseepsis]